jgi:hypothetical protein
VTRTLARVTFNPQTGQIVTVASTLPDYVPARCQCGALLLRVKLAGGWASVCVACKSAGIFAL